MNSPGSNDALQNLRDIHLPHIGGWWPPAPGWWVLFALVVLCMAAAGWWWRRRQRRNRRWLAIQHELAKLQARPQASAAWFGQLNGLLKRAARDCYPQQSIVALSGDDWAAFLYRSMNGIDDSAMTGPDAHHLRLMVHDCWRAHPHSNPQQALGLAARWLTIHKALLRSAP